MPQAAPSRETLFETPFRKYAPARATDVFILDNNVLPHFRNPPRNGKGLGDLLDHLQQAKRPTAQVCLLPAIAEANYRRNSWSVDDILKLHASWFDEHFGKFGVGAAWLFSSQAGLAPLQTLFEVFYRVVVNYWVVSTAQQVSLEHKGAKRPRPTVEAFFERVRLMLPLPPSKFPVLAAATALAGNTQGRNALCIRGGSPRDLMRGSWDLLYWQLTVQMLQRLDDDWKVPRYVSGDEASVGMFSDIRLTDSGHLLFEYGGATEQLELAADIATWVEGLVTDDGPDKTLIKRLTHSVPAAYQCPEYLKCLSRLGECLECCKSAAASGMWVSVDTSRSAGGQRG